jgi:hypothetical protein
LTWLDNDAPEAVLSFERTLGSDRVVVYINLTDKPVGRVADPSHGTAPLLERGVSEPFTLAAHGFYVGKRK